MTRFDLIIRGGTLVDGSGAAPRTADVAIRDGIVQEVGRIRAEATRVVDAEGALVTPGFVDIHAHYDGQATWDARMQPSSWHGVTTAVFGNCGVGFAPVHDHDRDRLVELMEGVEDIPGTALHEGLPWSWNDFAGYLDACDSPKDMDIGAQLPHGALRLHVMGERGAAREDATEEDIESMGRLAVGAFEAGALGFTTSRTTNHRTSTGDPTPTLTAAREELVGIARAVGSGGKGVFQVVSDFRDLDNEFSIFREMASVSGRPLSFSLIESPTTPDFHQNLLRRLEAARSEGLPITAQCAVRPIGILLGFECTLNPFMRLPVWAELAGLSSGERAKALRGSKLRRKLIAQAEAAEGREGAILIEIYDDMYEMDASPNYEPRIEDSIGRRASQRGISAPELCLDLLLERDGTKMLWMPFANFAEGNLDSTREMLMHPFTVPGLADGGAHVGTICDGSFPTTLLQHWARERARPKIPLEFLVQRQCRDTARTVGLFDRGVLAPGYRADLNVIDFENLRVREPELAYDLPAGGRRILQRATGYLHTFVAGEETYASGEETGALPGRLVRGAQPAPPAVSGRA
jgi:N-acyl-D-aspartate/D-glutamate deacylase